MSPIAGAALFAVLLVALVALAVGVITYNAVVALRNRIDKAWGNVEVALRQRHDQLPALVDAVRDLMAFEQDVLEEVTRQRARYAPDAPVAEQGAVSAATTTAVRSLFAVVEAYPQVRSQENVLRLQGEIERLEGQLADRRELYNDQVYRYNTTIAQVPARGAGRPPGLAIAIHSSTRGPRPSRHRRFPWPRGAMPRKARVATGPDAGQGPRPLACPRRPRAGRRPRPRASPRHQADPGHVAAAAGRPGGRVPRPRPRPPRARCPGRRSVPPRRRVRRGRRGHRRMPAAAPSWSACRWAPTWGCTWPPAIRIAWRGWSSPTPRPSRAR